jgi:putative Holliday junction resolvase
MRFLGIDPGEKRIGVALSDPTGTIANPITVIQHVSRAEDAAAIVKIATENQVEKIIIGQSLDDEGKPTPQGRRSARLREVILAMTDLPVELWDESGSTKAARSARIAMGVPRKKRRGHLDEIAATYILQDYLDAHSPISDHDYF